MKFEKKFEAEVPCAYPGCKGIAKLQWTECNDVREPTAEKALAWFNSHAKTRPLYCKAEHPFEEGVPL